MLCRQLCWLLQVFVGVQNWRRSLNWLKFCVSCELSVKKCPWLKGEGSILIMLHFLSSTHNWLFCSFLMIEVKCETLIYWCIKQHYKKKVLNLCTVYCNQLTKYHATAHTHTQKYSIANHIKYLTEMNKWCFKGINCQLSFLWWKCSLNCS